MSTANTTIIVKNSNTESKIPQLDDLVMGEIAINTYDGKIFFKRDREGEQDIVEFYAKVPVENVIYVKQNGDDEDEGASWDSAYRTIERAVEDAWKRNGAVTKIEIAPGIYTTRGFIDLPDNSIIHCTYRSVILRPEPGYEEVNVFRMGSGCFIEGPLFEGFRLDNLDNPTVGFAAVFRPGALITRTPYVHKIAVRSIPTWTQVAPPLDRDNGNPYVPLGGGVVMADGAVISPYSIYPNMMTWGATPVIHNGVGYVAKNGGLVNAVNAISIWAHKHFLAIDGGQIVLSACSTQFGDYTLVSQGTREIVQPYEIDQDVLTLTEEVDSANLIYSNANTIIDGMYADLVANNFTNTSISDEVSDDTLSFEDYTKRDANLFLRSLTWTLSSGNEKPMLDFSKGFYDTLGNITFTRTPYDFDKCYRDTGLISDAVAYDVLFGSNYRSIVAAKSYYRANAFQVLQNEKEATLLALEEQKSLTADILTGDALARSNALFDEMIDIITNGEGNADAYILPDPPGLTLEYETARDTLQTNKATLQNTIETWIIDQIAANTAPFDDFPIFTYDEAVCERDIGLIIDAIAYDIRFDSNFRAITAAKSYYRSGASVVTSSQKQATLLAFKKLKELVLAELSTFSSAIQDKAASLMNIILNVLNDGLTAVPDAIVPVPTGGTDNASDAGYENARILLDANREFIKEEIVERIFDQYPLVTYDKDACLRDVDLIIDALYYDLTYGGNVESRMAGNAYYSNTVLQLGSDEKAATLDAYTYMRDIIELIVTNQEVTQLQYLVEQTTGTAGSQAAADRLTSLLDGIIGTIDTGTSVTRVDPDITWVATDKNNAAVALFAADSTIRTAVTDHINTVYQYGFNSEACKRDVGLIIDAIVYDLTYGYNHADGFTGNIASYEAAQAYFVGSEAQYGTGEKDATIAALQQLQTEIATLLTAGPASTFAQARVGDVISVISGSTLSKPTVDTTWPLAAYQTAFADINTNRETISNEVMIYITQETKSLLGAFIRAYEYMLNEIDNTVGVTTEAKTIARALVDNHIRTLINPRKVDDPSVITAIGHTWTAVFAGVALTKVPPADNAATITESILELDRGVVIASGQDDQGSALFVGGMEINADTGELSGPPFQQAVNRISTRAAISRSF